jgi:allophanate hydrolase subunit 1
VHRSADFDDMTLNDFAASAVAIGPIMESAAANGVGGTVLRAAFCGFAPGFAYLTGLAPRYHLPRRPTPRPRVPSGAVAVAGEFTAVYPRPSPGGWHLIGRTDTEMWDPSRAEPALVAPGTHVRFVPVGP